MDGKLKKAACIFILISTGVFLSRCQQEETEAPGIQKREQNKAVTAAKKWFENSRQQLEALAFTETIDWDNAIVTAGEKGRTIEVPLLLKPNTTTNVVTDAAYKTYMRLLFVQDAENVYKVYDIIYTTKDNAFDNTNKGRNFEHIYSRYSGYITIQDSQNKIVYSGEYENGSLVGLHNQKKQSPETFRRYCRYYVIVGPTVTCSSWVWEFDFSIGSNWWGPPGSPGSFPPAFRLPINTDPCGAARNTTGISGTTVFLKAKSDIMQASADGKEHSITLGNTAGNVLTQAPMNNGGTNGVVVNQNWPAAIAAIHNHPNNTPLSAGDVYAAVTLNTKNSAFRTSFILTGGETYAIVVTDLKAAQDFVAAYPADISPIYPPEFPQVIFDQIQDVKTKFGESNEARTMVISLVLDNNNAGITLMKQDSSGKFNRIKIQQTTNSDGSKTFSAVPCN